MISASISCCDFIRSDGSKRKVHIAQQQEEEEEKGSSAQKRRPGADHLSGQSRDLASTTVDNLPPSGRYYQSATTKVPKCYYQSATTKVPKCHYQSATTKVPKCHYQSTKVLLPKCRSPKNNISKDSELLNSDTSFIQNCFSEPAI